MLNLRISSHYNYSDYVLYVWPASLETPADCIGVGVYKRFLLLKERFFRVGGL